ncbi:NAD-dependent epimerase/dehydratase family protein [Kutzneria buriramensis]|uniref:Nucleoside-diphosphate-sugar epimerase n=1 Tax=Kutzneria buriramensis TaxID=1045776 RepID=A0A3E0GSY5_9PSEU|nr:NAD-dependent epimerase/dehydratase family protein [Kutzneria buriramensis]REH26182.1 nucleoside-diphosphate-sugar epimerase [Kutzneria buriramensis]
MRVLVLGGTRFVGRAAVADAVRRGWQVTVFNRDLTGPAPDGVEAVRGDRTAGIAELTGHWDAVIDTWSGAPEAVADAARQLESRVGHYLYVSSGAVYRQPLRTGMTEQAPVVEAGDGDYSAAKVGSELVVTRHFGDDRALLARAGLILGPHEHVGRLPWWLARAARGGEMPAPGPRDLATQWVDARDLAAWLLDAAEKRVAGTFNAASPPGHTTMAALLETCVRVTGDRAELRWIDPEAITAAGIRPWSQLPIWVPPNHPNRPVQERDTSRAHAAGLRCRPMAQTVADTWRWMCAEGRTRIADWFGPKVGLSPAAEAELLRRPAGPARSDGARA